MCTLLGRVRGWTHTPLAADGMMPPAAYCLPQGPSMGALHSHQSQRRDIMPGQGQGIGCACKLQDKLLAGALPPHQRRDIMPGQGAGCACMLQDRPCLSVGAPLTQCCKQPHEVCSAATEYKGRVLDAHVAGAAFSR